ncbi:hypothetical protein ACQKKG_11100 [Brevundimonas sp. NPDC003935]|uniref:hypothetical protein n=1 Tax=unclassified Brevundimonas TaxID=2622653 RepID=UPI0025C382B0|nr:MULTISPECIES: hypothetical protein [unclassified Brevundimonas]
MRLCVISLVAALVAAVCLVIAFIAAGVGMISVLFVLVAGAALGLIVWTALRRWLSRERGRRPMRQEP